jgi:glycosyltransferase involved in cell wall biosynthesis
MSQTRVPNSQLSHSPALSESTFRDERFATADEALARLALVSDVVSAEADRELTATRRPVLSIVIPAYNEYKTILQIIDSVRQLDIDKQIIVVDDGSTDGTRELLGALSPSADLEVFLHEVNQGKGAALQTGFRLAEGEIVIVQDADLEYNPQDILKVIEPILQKQADVVYGSRYLENNHQNSSWIHRLGNWLLTQISNTANGQRLTDMETCYKAVRRDILEQLTIEQQRFGFEPELTSKLARRGQKILEVPVRYHARSWSEGKKIGVRDLIATVYCIFRYRYFA